MKKRIIIIIVLTLVALFLAGYFLLIKDAASELSLEQLKSEEQYQYGKLIWGMSRRETENVLGYKLTEDESRQTSASDKSYYLAPNTVTLNKYKATVSFEYYKNELNTVKLQFRVGEDGAEWFEDTVKQLTALYGEKSDSVDNTADVFDKAVRIMGYKWDTEETTLQILMISGEATPTVVLGVGVR